MKLEISSHKLSIETGLTYDNVPSDKRLCNLSLTLVKKLKMKLNFTSLSKLNSSITDVFFPKREPIIPFLRLLQMKQVTTS